MKIHNCAFDEKIYPSLPLSNILKTLLAFIIHVTSYPLSFLTKNDDGHAPSFPQDEDSEMPLLDDDWVSRIVIFPFSL